MAKVFIGVGHGGKDAGAVANGLRENDLNLEVSLYLREALQRHNISVGISRTKDEDDDISEEIRECNAFNPDLAIDVHTNAGGGHGFEIFHSRFTTGNSYKMAKNINDVMVSKGYKSRGLKIKLNSNGDDYFGFIRSVNAPSVIAEMAFIDNLADISNFDEPHELRAYAECLCEGILRTLNIAYIPDNNDNNDDNYNNITVGSMVIITGTHYATGQVVSGWAKKQIHTVAQIDGDRALLSGINSWVYLKDLQISSSFAIGAKVKIIGTHYATGQVVSEWAKKQEHVIEQIDGDKALLGGINSWVYLKDLQIVL